MGLLSKAEAYLLQEQKAAEKQAAKNFIKGTATGENDLTAAELLDTVETGEIEYAPKEVKFHEEELNRSYARAFTPKPMPVMTAAKKTKVKSVSTTTTAKKSKPLIKHSRPKLKKFVAGFMMGLALQTATPLSFFNFNKSKKYKGTVIERAKYQPVQTPNEAEIVKHLEAFKQGLQLRVTPTERELLAKMLYGEAGRGADPFEVLHTVLNRKASPLFKGSIADIVTAPNQYVGYRASNPVTANYLRIVNMVVDEWIANGGEKIDGCNRYYFVTGKAGDCNMFEESEDLNGRWVPHAEKKYAALHDYCPLATNQSIRYYATTTPSNERTR